MIVKYFQNKFSLTEEGAKNLKSASIWSGLLRISFVLPMILALVFLNDYVNLVLFQGLEPKFSLWHYIGASVFLAFIIWVIAYIEYDKNYSRVYSESAITRIQLAETLRKLPLAFFGKKDLADLTATVMDDATQFEQIFSHSIPQLFGSIISGVFFLICLSFYNWQLALALAWVIPVAVLVFYSGKNINRRTLINHNRAQMHVSDKIQEGLDKAQEIKSYGQEDVYLQELNELVDTFEDKKKKMGYISVFVQLSSMILKLGLPSVILLGTYLLAQGNIDIFTFIVFLVVSNKIYDPFLEVASNSANMSYLDSRIDRIKEIQNMPRQSGKTEFAPKNMDIEFKNVDFSYQEGEQTIKNASFIAKQGEITALIGPSGGGKSTLAKLAARFWDIDGGEILLGGENIAQIEPETLLKHFSIVFQDVRLFNTSIMDNIRLGRENATDEEVKRVAKLAQCEEFIEKLPHGYNTLIGEDGEKLSGGERQRISIARALLKDAPIILLDEATASLDAENETKIQKAISELIKNKTVLIIAHRMRTVSGADKIVGVKNGKIEEVGAPEELQAKGGIFAEMVKLQTQS